MFPGTGRRADCWAGDGLHQKKMLIGRKRRKLSLTIEEMIDQRVDHLREEKSMCAPSENNGLQPVFPNEMKSSTHTS